MTTRLRPPSRYWLSFAIILGTALLFGLLVWPTAWEYRTMGQGWGVEFLRVHRSTGEVQLWDAQREWYSPVATAAEEMRERQEREARQEQAKARAERIQSKWDALVESGRIPEGELKRRINAIAGQDADESRQLVDLVEKWSGYPRLKEMILREMGEWPED